MKTIETTVYSFDELSDSAKEKAREWYRDVMADEQVDESIRSGEYKFNEDGKRFLTPRSKLPD